MTGGSVATLKIGWADMRTYNPIMAAFLLSARRYVTHIGPMVGTR